MAKYSKKAQEKIKEEMHKYKHEGKWQSPKQAIAVGISQAAKKGYKVPRRKGK